MKQRLAAGAAVPCPVKSSGPGHHGLSPARRDIFSGTLLRFSAFDEEGGVRGIELDGHPFFIGTLFQPELAALNDEVHPVVVAFVRAVLAFAARAG